MRTVAQEAVTDAFPLPLLRSSDEVKNLHREATALNEVMADLTLESRLPEKA